MVFRRIRSRYGDKTHQTKSGANRLGNRTVLPVPPAFILLKYLKTRHIFQIKFTPGGFGFVGQLVFLRLLSEATP